MQDPQILLYLIPLAVIELGLKVVALISLSRAERVRGGSKAIWGALILFVGFFGSVLWFVLGRDDTAAR